jgi:hypothetical protein
MYHHGMACRCCPIGPQIRRTSDVAAWTCPDAVGTAPLCNVVGATAAPEREQFIMLSINVLFSDRLFNNRCPLMRPRCHPGRSCSCQAENPVGRSLPPQTGQAGTKVPGWRQGQARYTTATQCGGFVVAPLLQEVPPRLGDVQLLCCADAGGCRNGGVRGVVGSG